MILENCWLVTMDDAGSEYARGWLQVEDGLISALGAGDPPEHGEDLHGAVVAAARELGCTLEAPFQLLSFLALSVIPSLKLTDHGLIDVDRFEVVPLAVAGP